MKITLILLLTFSLSVLYADTPINYGDNITSSIQQFGEEDVFTFEGTTGDRIYIRMRDAESPVDACFQLIDPSGILLENPCGSGGIVQLKNFTLLSSGFYQIVAKDRGDNDTGSYGLSLSLLNAPEYAQAIPCDFDATETLFSTCEIKSYSFSAQKNDRVWIRMRGVNTHIESEIEIYNSAGDLLVKDSGSGISTIGPYKLPDTDSYLLLAMDKNGNDLGEFGLSLQLVSNNECSEELVCGDNIMSSIDHLGQIKAYTVYCEDGDQILFSARSENSSFESQLFLFSPDGQELVQSYSKNKQVEILSEDLDEGYYQIAYIDSRGNDLGDYGLSIQIISSRNCGEELDCSDDPEITSILSTSAMKSYIFTGEKHAKVSLKAYALDPHIDPLLRLYDPNGRLVAREFSYQLTNINSLTLNMDGEYILIAQDLSGNDLGEFELEITKHGYEITPSLPELPVVNLSCGQDLVAPTASAPCGPTIIGTLAEDISFQQPGDYEITWQYEDSEGNMLYQDQIIHFSDQTGPQITCTEIFTFEIGNGGELWLTQNDFADLVSDDCSGVSFIEISQQYFNCDQLGENFITLWTEDNNGNSSSCELTIIISDSQDYCTGCEDLPNPWTLQDIGDVPIDGSACYNPNVPQFEITGSGDDLFGTSDEFTFVHRELCGDADIIARVTNISGGEAHAFSGIMMRKNLSDNDKYAGIMVTNTEGIYYQARTKKDSYTLYEQHEGSPQIWLKLSRRGNMVTGYTSENGIHWNLACELVVKLGSCYYAGMMVNSNSSETSSTGTFDHVSIQNFDSRQAFISDSSPSSLSLADPCPFEIEHRGDTPNCAEQVSSKAVLKKGVPIFPNPAREYVNIDFEEFLGEDIQVRLISQRGKLKYEKRFKIAPYGLQINLQDQNIPSGLYHLQIISKEGIFSNSISILKEY